MRHVRGDLRRSRTSTRECPDTGFGKMDCFNTSEQIVRITFDEAQNIFEDLFIVRRDCHSSKPGVVLAWLPAGQSTWQEGVRQQFNFSPPNTTQERELYTANILSPGHGEFCYLPDSNALVNLSLVKHAKRQGVRRKHRFRPGGKPPPLRELVNFRSLCQAQRACLRSPT